MIIPKLENNNKRIMQNKKNKNHEDEKTLI